MSSRIRAALTFAALTALASITVLGSPAAAAPAAPHLILNQQNFTTFATPGLGGRTYLQWQNTGTPTAVTVVVGHPAGWRLVPFAGVAAAGECTDSPTQFVCQTSDPGMNAQVHVFPPATFAVGARITLPETIAPTGGPVADRATVPVENPGVAKLGVTLVPTGRSSVPRGQVLTMRATIVNHGPAPARHVNYVIMLNGDDAAVLLAPVGPGSAVRVSQLRETSWGSTDSWWGRPGTLAVGHAIQVIVRIGTGATRYPGDLGTARVSASSDYNQGLRGAPLGRWPSPYDVFAYRSFTIGPAATARTVASRPGLAATGPAPVRALLGWAAMLVLAGSAVLVVGRRRPA